VGHTHTHTHTLDLLACTISVVCTISQRLVFCNLGSGDARGVPLSFTAQAVSRYHFHHHLGPLKPACMEPVCVDSCGDVCCGVG